MLVLLIAGLQVPEIPFEELLGNVKFVPVQNGPTGSKVGVVCAGLNGITIVVS